MDQPIKRVDDSRDFLAQLQLADCDALLSIGKRRSFAKNDFIFKAGETDLSIWVLQSGRVKLYGSSAQGREVLLSFILAGEIFGLAECLQEQPRLIYASAAESCEGGEHCAHPVSGMAKCPPGNCFWCHENDGVAYARNRPAFFKSNWRGKYLLP